MKLNENGMEISRHKKVYSSKNQVYISQYIYMNIYEHTCIYIIWQYDNTYNNMYHTTLHVTKWITMNR